MAENRAALLIATFEYDDPYFRPLKSPAQDVKALSSVLSDPAIGGFQVQTLVNEPKDVLALAIEEFLDERSRDDTLLLYFSCHGIKDEDGRLYYAARTTRHKRLVATGVPAYQVNDLIAKSRSRRKVLVPDCCYSGAFSKAFLAKGDAAVGVMDQFSQGQGLVTLASSDAFQYSFEGEELGPGGEVCSVFTRALVEGIESGKADEDGDRMISLDELYHYAYERVHGERPEQNPRRSGEVEGDIFIARNPHPQSVELPEWLRKELESDHPLVKLGAVQELDRLLHGRNRGLALIARRELVRLSEHDDSSRVRTRAAECLHADAPADQQETPATRTAADRGTREAEPKQSGPETGAREVRREETTGPAREEAPPQAPLQPPPQEASRPRYMPVWGRALFLAAGWIFTTILAFLVSEIIRGGYYAHVPLMARLLGGPRYGRLPVLNLLVMALILWGGVFITVLIALPRAVRRRLPQFAFAWVVVDALAQSAGFPEAGPAGVLPVVIRGLVSGWALRLLEPSIAWRNVMVIVAAFVIGYFLMAPAAFTREPALLWCMWSLGRLLQCAAAFWQLDRASRSARG